MKKSLSVSLILLCLLSPYALADSNPIYRPDIVLTHPDGIWVDSRAYSSLSAAISAIAGTDRTLLISRNEIVTTLNIPSNINLAFIKNGAITNSGTLTLNQATISAPNHRIFKGTGAVDASGMRQPFIADWAASVTAAAATQAPVIQLLSKTYTVSSEITLYDNQTLAGQGHTSVLQADAGLTGMMISNEDDTNGNSNITVKDLKVFGNGESAEGITFLGDASTNILISNVWVDYCLNRAITIDHGVSSRIIGNKVTRYGAVLADGQGSAPSDDGIRITYGQDCEISGNYIDNSGLITAQHTNDSTFGRHGITLGSNQSYRNTVTNNFIKTTERHGINVEGNSGDARGADQSIVSNNHVIDAGTTGIVATSDNCLITNNIIEDAGQNCISIKGHTEGNVIVSVNTLINCGVDPLTVNIGSDAEECGIHADGSGLFKVIKSNIITGAIGSGIYLERTWGDVFGNSIFSSGGPGIRTASDDWAVIGNTIKDSADSGITTATGLENLLIALNTVYDNTVYGIEVDNSLRSVIGLNKASGNANNFYALDSNTLGTAIGNLGDAGLFIVNRGPEFGGYILGVREEEKELTGASVDWNNAIPDGSLVLGVSTRITEAITGATGYQVGLADASDDDRYGDVAAIALDTTTDGEDYTITSPVYYTTGPGIRITAKTSNFTDGTIRISVTYLEQYTPTE